MNLQYPTIFPVTNINAICVVNIAKTAYVLFELTNSGNLPGTTQNIFCPALKIPQILNVSRRQIQLLFINPGLILGFMTGYTVNLVDICYYPPCLISYKNLIVCGF